MNGSCKSCQHYNFYLMITGGPYGYAGTIPCTGCSRFSYSHDNYEPKQPGGFTVTADELLRKYGEVNGPIETL